MCEITGGARLKDEILNSQVRMNSFAWVGGAASLITKSEQRCVRNEFGLGVCVVFFDGNPIIEKKRLHECAALRSANVDGAPL